MALAIGYVHRFCLSLAITEMAEKAHSLNMTHRVNTGTECISNEIFDNTTLSKKVIFLFFFFD